MVLGIYIYPLLFCKGNERKSLDSLYNATQFNSELDSVISLYSTRYYTHKRFDENGVLEKNHNIDNNV